MVNLEAQEGPLQLKAAQIRSISSSFRVIRDRKKKFARKIRKELTTFLFCVFRHFKKYFLVLIDFLVPKSLRNCDLSEKQKSEGKKTDF